MPVEMTLEHLVERNRGHSCPDLGPEQVCVRMEAVADLPTRFGDFRVAGLEEHGVRMSGRISLVVPPNEHNVFYLSTAEIEEAEDGAA